MENYWYVIIGVLATASVGVMLKLANYWIKDAHFETAARRMDLLGDEIRLEFFASNKTSSLKELLDLQIIYVINKKSYVYARLSIAPISRRPDSLTDVGLDKEKRYFLSIQPQSSNALVLSFTPVDEPLPKNVPTYLCAIDARGKTVYAPFVLKASGIQRLHFKRCHFKRG